MIMISFPVDETRVTLEEIDGEEGSDYINANFILVSLTLYMTAVYTQVRQSVASVYISAGSVLNA